MKLIKMEGHQVRVYVVTLWLALCYQPVFSQSLLQSRQFYFDPYLFNVAYTGEEDKTHLLLYYRQQWLQVADGPTNLGFNFQHPATRKMALGFSFNSATTVALHKDDMLSSFAYKISFKEKHSLRLGISGGVGVYRLDLGNADFSNDPIILNSAAGRYYAIGNFGLLYTFGKLKVGAALPELFGKNHLARSGGFNQLLNQLYSIYYDYSVKALPVGFGLTNYFLYRLSYDYQNFWEGGMIVKWKNIIDAGVTYRQNSGLGFILGARPVSYLGFSYSYEPRPAAQDFVKANSHEVHINLYFLDIIKNLKHESAGPPKQ